MIECLFRFSNFSIISIFRSIVLAPCARITIKLRSSEEALFLFSNVFKLVENHGLFLLAVKLTVGMNLLVKSVILSLSISQLSLREQEPRLSSKYGRKSRNSRLINS